MDIAISWSVTLLSILAVVLPFLLGVRLFVGK
jgi:hypothetical protein